MRKFFLILLVWSTTLLAQDSLHLPAPLNQLQIIGEGRLRYFGFHVYDASTWSTSATPLTSVDALAPPFALQIRYAREIKAADLIEKTRDAWHDLGLVLPDETQWLQSLTSMWPDVKKGDVIVCYVDDSKQASFYVNGVLKGQIASAAFSHAFLAIWLDKKAEFSELQQQLIGRGEGE